MVEPSTTPLPLLPLLLWDTPPALEQVLTQEGIPWSRADPARPWTFADGRFVLHDGRRRAPTGGLTGQHLLIDVGPFRAGEAVDPFRALIDTEARPSTWAVGGLELTERVARYPKAQIRRRLVAKLSAAVVAAGGLWARLSAFPFPHRSAFNLRVDLDEPAFDDYRRFARARRPIDDCTSHFISTRAYGGRPEILRELRDLDPQSHGHHHVVVRDEAANRRNFGRAHAILADAGITPTGYAAPEGRWNPGLDRVASGLGYRFGTEFQLGYEDRPFCPWLGDKFSEVLQIPVHPICEGLFLDAGVQTSRPIADHLIGVVRRAIEAGEPAFVYGHPEGRLGRFPEVVTALADAVAAEPRLWRTTMGEFARWWRWRSTRRWGIRDQGEGLFGLQFEEWDNRYSVAVEIVRGAHVARFPVSGSRSSFRLDDLAYERSSTRSDPPSPRPGPRKRGVGVAIRAALDWETVTPVEELPAATVAGRLKRGLRRWRS